MTVIESTLIVSRRDASTTPVIDVRDVWEFDTAEQQREFTEEYLAWLDDRPVPNDGHLPRNRYKGEHRLIEILDICHGPATLWEGYITPNGQDATVFDIEEDMEHVTLIKNASE